VNGLHSAAESLPLCFLASDVGGWRRKKSGWFLEWSEGEEKRRECDVWPRVEWSGGGEEKKRVFSQRRKVFWFPKTLHTTPARVF